jgi:TolB protein
VNFLTKAISSALVIASAAFAADVVITSEQKGAETIALGFLDFKCVKGDPKSIQFQPHTVIAWDLEFSGRFKLRSAAQFDTAAKLLMKEDGALGYVRGEYGLEGKNFTLQCELIDIESGERIIGKKYSGNQSELRQAAHKFSDELVYQLFGEKGIAQTRITYVNKRANKEIFVMDYDGSGVQEITKNKSINLTPAWLEGRAKVIFTSYLAGQPQFYVKDMEKGKQEAFGGAKGMPIAGGYNRMDKEIVYTSSQDGNSEIYPGPSTSAPPGLPTAMKSSSSPTAAASPCCM